MSLIHCTEYRSWRLPPPLSLFATRNYPVATLQLPCNFALSSSLTCNSLVPHRQQVWNRREPSVGVTEGGLMNPTISGSYEAGRWNSKTWVSRFLSFVSVLRRKPAEDEHRSSLLPPFPFHPSFLSVNSFFSLPASSWRLGHLLSKIFVSLIFALLSQDVNSEKVFLAGRRH